jgi:hypothetical protein
MNLFFLRELLCQAFSGPRGAILRVLCARVGFHCNFVLRVVELSHGRYAFDPAAVLVYKQEISFPGGSVSRVLAALILASVLIAPIATKAQTASSSPDKPFVVEYYYKTKWGHAEEFLKLFKKNHYPLLKKQVEMGRMVKVWMDQPRYHSTEDGRWDYRVTIVFKNATVANEVFDEDTLKKQLFPDQDTYQHEEQRRFAILDAHWDVPIKMAELEK